jgi:hypothetical protein
MIPATSPWLRVATITEQHAFVGVGSAFACVLWLIWKRQRELAAVTAIAAAAFLSMVGKYDVWADAYASGRVLSPLLAMLALMALMQRRVLLAVPMLLFLPRVLLQYQPALKRVLSELF